MTRDERSDALWHRVVGALVGGMMTLFGVGVVVVWRDGQPSVAAFLVGAIGVCVVILAKVGVPR